MAEQILNVPQSLVQRLADFMLHFHPKNPMNEALQEILEEGPEPGKVECVGFEMVCLERGQIWDRRLASNYDRARDMRGDLLKKGYEVQMFGLIRAPKGSVLGRPEPTKKDIQNGVTY